MKAVVTLASIPTGSFPFLADLQLGVGAGDGGGGEFLSLLMGSDAGDEESAAQSGARAAAAYQTSALEMAPWVRPAGALTQDVGTTAQRESHSTLPGSASVVEGVAGDNANDGLINGHHGAGDPGVDLFRAPRLDAASEMAPTAATPAPHGDGPRSPALLDTVGFERRRVDLLTAPRWDSAAETVPTVATLAPHGDDLRSAALLDTIDFERRRVNPLTAPRWVSASETVPTAATPAPHGDGPRSPALLDTVGLERRRVDLLAAPRWVSAPETVPTVATPAPGCDRPTSPGPIAKDLLPSRHSIDIDREREAPAVAQWASAAIGIPVATNADFDNVATPATPNLKIAGIADRGSDDLRPASPAPQYRHASGIDRRGAVALSAPGDASTTADVPTGLTPVPDRKNSGAPESIDAPLVPSSQRLIGMDRGGEEPNASVVTLVPQFQNVVFAARGRVDLPTVAAATPRPQATSVTDRSTVDSLPTSRWISTAEMNPSPERLVAQCQTAIRAGHSSVELLPATPTTPVNREGSQTESASNAPILEACREGAGTSAPHDRDWEPAVGPVVFRRDAGLRLDDVAQSSMQIQPVSTPVLQGRGSESVVGPVADGRGARSLWDGPHGRGSESMDEPVSNLIGTAILPAISSSREHLGSALRKPIKTDRSTVAQPRTPAMAPDVAAAAAAPVREPIAAPRTDVDNSTSASGDDSVICAAQAEASSAPQVPTPPLLDQNVAFGARVVERDAAPAAPIDSFVSGSTKAVTGTQDTAGYMAAAQPAAAQYNAMQRSEAPPHVERTAVEAPTAVKAEPIAAARISPPAAVAEFAVEIPAARRDAESPVHEAAAVRVPESSVPENKPAQPVRDVTVRLTADNQQVDVKLVDRGGEIHVAVRSADAALTSDLRASVHDLIGGLEKSGFRAETWQPGESTRHASAATASDAPQQSQHNAPGEDARRQGRNPHDGEQTPTRRTRISDDNSIEWMRQMSAFSELERNN